MKQLISFDTRVTEFSSTKIDFLYSTSDQVKTKCLNSWNKTDHGAIEFSVPVGKELRMRLTINVTYWECYNEDNLMALLRVINLNELNYGNLDERVENYNAVLINIMNTLTFNKYVHNKLVNKLYNQKLTHLN